ncbi:MAG TPA: ATP-binding cassette domain-containing protein [Woeseiaceae bacterium]|nr:ATP-binding cassette domain-containing protein [Woeseiaceae bacterium]
MSPLLEVRELVVTFGTTFSVGPMNLVASRGIIHLEGPNGGGKTSILRAMSGELPPSHGSVSVNGQDVYTSVAARRDLAFVPSIPELPEFLTVSEACEFAASLRGAPDWDGEPYREAMGLDPGLRLGHASAGQRRKAELMCALAGDPAILLLDETFVHLDERSAAQLTEWVSEWSLSRVIVLTHHGVPPVSVDEVLHVSAGNAVVNRDDV